MKSVLFIIILLSVFTLNLQAQTEKDLQEIKKVALAYIESQHKPNPKLMKSALHPLLVKRSVFKNKETKKDYISETKAEYMEIVAETYNKKGDKFPANPKKEVKILDAAELTASVKITADDWIDYLHVAKVNGEWKIINVLWQYNDVSKHQ